MLPNILLFTAMGSVAAAAVTNTVSSYISDAQDLKLQRQQKLHPYARQYRARPLLSVVTTSYNDAANIEKYLQALLRSSYRKLEIIIVDRASTDTTRQMVKAFTRANPDRKIRLLSKRQMVSKTTALTDGRRLTKGDLVVYLEPTTVVDTLAFKKAITAFNARPVSASLQLKIKSADQYSIFGLFQQFEQFVGQRLRKPANLWPASAIHSVDAIVYDVAPRTMVGWLKSSYGQRLNWQPIMFRRQLSVLKAPAKISRRIQLLTSFALLSGFVASLTLPILIGYFLYLALALHEPAFLVVSAVAAGSFLLLSIWDDHQMPFGRKLFYSLISPVSYAAFYILMLVEYCVLLRKLSLRLARA